MTREEIEILQAAYRILDRIPKWYHGIEHELKIDENDIKAIEVAKLAIEALQTEQVTWIVGNNNAQVAVKNMPIDKMKKICAIIGDEQTENCEDTISRQAVDDYISHWMSGYIYDEERTRLEEFSAWLLDELPSVKPAHKVIRCKDCKHRDPEDKKCDCGCWHFPFVTKDDDFCSYAEAKMEEGETE